MNLKNKPHEDHMMNYARIRKREIDLENFFDYRIAPTPKTVPSTKTFATIVYLSSKMIKREKYRPTHKIQKEKRGKSVIE